MRTYHSFNEEDKKAFSSPSKIGVIGTVSDGNLPHLTIITTMLIKGDHQIVMGQFTEGVSKENLQKDPKMCFLVLTADKKIRRGKALWAGLKHEGEDYINLNKIPLFRYNSYFGIHTVHYLDLVEYYGTEKLPMPSVVAAVLATRASAPFQKKSTDKEVMKPWAVNMFNQMSTLKFLSYINKDGFSVVIPVIQCRSAGSSKLIFSFLAYGKELKEIPQGADVAVLGFTMQMENCLVRGKFSSKRSTGLIDIQWVYNSMPPKPEQIYPPVALKAVVSF